MNTSWQSRPRVVSPGAWLCALVNLILLPACSTTATPLWELVDPGGGGAAPAIYRVPDSGHLFVSSNVGGFRYSSDAGAQFRVVNEGLDFSSSAADNIQVITGYSIGDTHHVIGSATAGILYWRSIGPGGLGPAWEKFFDARRAGKRGATTIGALTVDPSMRHVYAGVGNPNNLMHNRLTALDPDLSGQVLVFRIGDDQSDAAPPQPAGALSLTDICSELEGGPYFHVTDLAAVSIEGREYLYVGTSEGLLIVREPQSSDVACERRLVPGRNPFVLSVQPDAENPGDVVLLLNEVGLERHNDRSGKRAWPEHKGGLFHTESALASAPVWKNITPAEAQGKGLGELERGRMNAGELVLTGDARSSLGVLYTQDFSTERWQSVLDRSFIRPNRSTRDLDGWRRTEGAFNGVKEIAVDEAGDGIDTLYVAGFQGRVLSGRREADGFRFEQSYTIVDARAKPVRYLNRGLPLMVPWRAFPDPRDGERVIFLYHDNLFFVSDDAGSSFSRPVMKFGWGTDVVFDPGSERIFLAYTVGNHLEAGGRNLARQGGLLIGQRQASEWKEARPRLPASGPLESLATVNGELCANVYRKGVFCTAMERKFAWRRAVPKSLSVLHLVDVDADEALWVVTEDGQTMRICRVSDGEPACSELPVTASEFERLWFDGGQLWLVAKRGTSFSSSLQPSLQWERVDAAITDVRTLSLGTAQIALIASGSEGLFASRTPREPDSWCQLSFDGLDGNRVITDIGDPAGGDRLFVAVAGVGFYRASLDALEQNVTETCSLQPSVE